MVFPIISQLELSVAMATTVLMNLLQNIKAAFPPIQMMQHIKSVQDWPTDLGDSIMTIKNLICHIAPEVTDLIRLTLKRAV